MISVHDLYVVLSAVVPLYVAMILAYGSVRWWKFLTPDQCSGINRFVALFAVPLLSFHFIASNNPYHMNTKYIVADVAQKLVVLLVLCIWAWLARTGSLEWLITIFMLATLPNTLVMGIPLLQSMYGGHTDNLMVQFVVLQSIIWYTILLILYEYRAAKMLVMQRFPDTATRIAAINVDSDVLSIDGRDAIDTEAEEREDGKIVVNVRRSVSSRSDAINYTPRSTPRRSSVGLRSMRPSNLSGTDIYSLHSSVNLTPRNSNFTNADFSSMLAGGRMASPRPSNFTSSDVYSLQSSRGPTPRSSNFNEDACQDANFGHLKTPLHVTTSPRFPLLLSSRGHTGGAAAAAVAPFDSPPPVAPAAAATGPAVKPPPPPFPCTATSAPLVSPSPVHAASAATQQISRKSFKAPEEDARELHMFLWSSAASPANDFSPHRLSDHQGRQQDGPEPKEVHLLVMPSAEPSAAAGPDFSFGTRADVFVLEDHLEAAEPKHESGGGTPAAAKTMDPDKPISLPPTSVMFKLIVTMTCKKLARNPNTYGTLIGVIWSLVAFKYHFRLPAIIDNSVTILSDAGLGMAMFSLGLFMALQKRLVVCGPQLAAFSMIVRFLTGPAVMAAVSIAVGLRGRELHIAVVQAALPVGIVPFVFAKEYDVHADILSTALIFGIFIALPVTIGYYVIMGT